MIHEPCHALTVPVRTTDKPCYREHPHARVGTGSWDDIRLRRHREKIAGKSVWAIIALGERHPVVEHASRVQGGGRAAGLEESRPPARRSYKGREHGYGCRLPAEMAAPGEPPVLEPYTPV